MNFKILFLFSALFIEKSITMKNPNEFMKETAEFFNLNLEDLE